MYEELLNIIEDSDNIVFFGGAGVSVPSGIPDFRSVDGIYSNNLKAEELLSNHFYYAHPRDFYDFYFHHMLYLEAKPNDFHKALKLLEDMGKLKAIVTQNIDGLHQLAGSKTVYELHGTIHSNTCLKCGKKYDLGYFISSKDGLGIPRCTCKGALKPDVVLYEEPLSHKTISEAIEAIEKAEVLIVGGTSLTVYPAANFIKYFKGKYLIYIDKATPSNLDRVDLAIQADIGTLGTYLLTHL